VREASPLFFVKRGFLYFGFLIGPFLHMAGLGGEEVGKFGFKVGRCCGSPRLEPLEIWLFTAFHPQWRWRCPAAATRGHRDGHVMLDARCTSFFFLFARIFCSFKAASKSLVQPSGLVPGWDWGGAAQLLLAAGGEQGSDCFQASYARVCSVKVKGLVVISIFFQPSCNFTHRWMNLWVLLDLTR
jgi:hypothetical protein